MRRDACGNRVLSPEAHALLLARDIEAQRRAGFSEVPDGDEPLTRRALALAVLGALAIAALGTWLALSLAAG